MAEMTIPTPDAQLPAILHVPPGARGIVVFAHGSGSSRLSPRNQFVAATLRQGGHLGTLLFDLLTAEEDQLYENRFEIDLLTARLVSAIDWLGSRPDTSDLRLGIFGASTGAAAALGAAAERPDVVRSVVSRGGRPDLAEEARLSAVRAPTLLVVGGDDPVVIALNRRALASIGARDKKLELVPGATHLFEEPGTLERVAELSSDWFAHFLG